MTQIEEDEMLQRRINYYAKSIERVKHEYESIKKLIRSAKKFLNMPFKMCISHLKDRLECLEHIKAYNKKRVELLHNYSVHYKEMRKLQDIWRTRRHAHAQKAQEQTQTKMISREEAEYIVNALTKLLRTTKSNKFALKF